jgi:hypothetical protein
MHRRWPGFAIAGVLVILASPVGAAPLASATWSSNLQGVQLVVTNAGATCTDTLGTHVQQSIVCPSAGLGATGTWVPTSFSVSLTMPRFSLRQFTTDGAIPVSTQARLSGAAAIQGGPSAAAATMGVAGGVTVRVARHFTKGANRSMWTGVGFSTLAKVPLSVGA